MVRPKSRQEDAFRRETILNILLLGSLVLSAVACALVLIDHVVLGAAYMGESPIMALFTLLLFLTLTVISRSGRWVVAAYLLVALYFLLALATLWVWGISLAEGVLILSLSVVMTSILLGTRQAAVVTVLAAAGLVGLGYLQENHLIVFNSAWMKTPGSAVDAVAFSVTLGVITVVSWLSNREIERSLERARKSETALMRERDSLEVKVKERTKELEMAQREKIIELSKFAEFGRLTSGIVHELVTPLTTVALNLEQIDDSVHTEKLKRAIDSTKRMERYISVARKQLQNQSEETIFSLAEEVVSAMDFLVPQADKRHVTIDFVKSSEPTMRGNPIKFSQLVTNLASNAVAAYDNAAGNVPQRVVIELQQTESTVFLTVRDWGSGIPKAYLKRVFDPFFTLKRSDQAMGIGLSLCKEIAEKDFGGTIGCSSDPAEGTIFTVRLPLQHKSKK
jgi:signal transduction histidine kinase